MLVPFEILEHPADVGFLAHGETPGELFQNAALALCSLACEPDSIEERESRAIVARGASMESLLYAWLAEILAVADAEQLAFRRVEVEEFTEPASPGEGNVRGVAIGEGFDRERHGAGTYVKAVTYHQFAVERTPEYWRARVFLDL